jgi:hypothetical protein
MFPNQLVLRGASYSQLLLRPPVKLAFPKMSVLRWKGDAGHLMESALKRSCEEVGRFLIGCGGSVAAVVPYVEESERVIPFPFPLFSSNLENEYYAQKFPFCEFLDISPGQIPAKSSALWVFTWSDLSEMPAIIERMIFEQPFAFYMFIPAQFVRDAFREMISIFERQAKRIEYVQSGRNTDSPTELLHYVLTAIPFDFVTVLHATLIHLLNCPIGLIAPIH